MALAAMGPRLRSSLVRLAGLLACGSVPLSHAVAQGEDAVAGEAQIKAAYLYKFAGYVEWPKRSFRDPDSAIVIGVIGADEIAEELRRIVPGRSVQNRALAVGHIARESDLSAIHVLFVGRDAMARQTRLIETARQRPILIVTDVADGLERGSVINFVPVRRRVHFEISTDAAEKVGLGLSSRLLSVALRVKKGDLDADFYLARMPAGARAALGGYTGERRAVSFM